MGADLRNGYKDQPMTKWNAIFTATGGIVILTVEAEDDEAAISVALEMGKEEFGWDLSSFNAEASPAYDWEWFSQ